MNFAECLREYMDAAGLNISQLAAASDLSASSISRYLKGKQRPGDDVLLKLASVLAESIHGCGDAAALSAVDTDEIFSKLLRAASGITSDYETCIDNLHALLSALNVSNTELARILSYDPSYISRILGGSRKPANLPELLSDVSDYLGRRFYNTAKATSIFSIIGDDGNVSSADELSQSILMWLGQPHAKEAPHISHFLDKLDEFDLNDFMASIHFEDIKIPTMPFQLPGTKTYTGIKEMMQAELDFLKYAVLSKSSEDVILYSDMPMEEMSRDEDFPKKWMMGMALLIRKGLILHMIHDVHRPLPEMLLGLEGWIPMYMTGQVHPYYLPDQTNQHFMHFIRSAGTVAISGEAIFGCHACGRYVVTRTKEDVAYYRQRAKDLLNRGKPLMEIYRREQMESLRDDVSEVLKRSVSLHSLSNVPPLFTMSEDLLDDVLSHNDMQDFEIARIKDYHRKLQEYASSWLLSASYTLDLSEIKPEDYAEHPARLPLSEIFPSSDIRYSEDEYRRHIKEANKYAGLNPKFSISLNPSPAFRNIDITISPGHAVLVSKSNPPIIHFLILHPRMIEAFEQFAPPIIE